MRKCLSLLIAAVLISLVGCTAEQGSSPAASIEVMTKSPTEKSPIATEAAPEQAPPVVPEREIELVAKTLRGECYDDEPDDKREVAKVICNRVSDGRFGDSVEAVVTAPRQFAGYRPDNVPTENDYEIAREVLTAWYECGCAPMGEYLYFTAGSGKVNIFSKEWREQP
jgi:hypothetical protein